MIFKTNIAVLATCALLMGSPTVRAASGTVRGAGQCDAIIDQVFANIERLYGRPGDVSGDGYKALIELAGGHVWDAPHTDNINQFVSYGKFYGNIKKDTDGTRYFLWKNDVFYSDRSHFSRDRDDSLTLEITTYPTTITTINHSWGDATRHFTPTHCELLGSQIAVIQAIRVTDISVTSHTLTIKPGWIIA